MRSPGPDLESYFGIIVAKYRWSAHRPYKAAGSNLEQSLRDLVMCCGVSHPGDQHTRLSTVASRIDHERHKLHEARA